MAMLIFFGLEQLKNNSISIHAISKLKWYKLKIDGRRNQFKLPFDR